MIRYSVYLMTVLVALISSTVSVVTFQAGISPMLSALAGVATILVMATGAEVLELLSSRAKPACADCGSREDVACYCTAPGCDNRLCGMCVNRFGFNGYCVKCEAKWRRDNKPRHECACGKGAACCGA